MVKKKKYVDRACDTCHSWRSFLSHAEARNSGCLSRRIASTQNTLEVISDMCSEASFKSFI